MFACASRRVGWVVIAIHPESCENVKAPPFSPTGNFISLAPGAVPLTITSLSPSSGDMRYATHWPFGESDVAFMARNARMSSRSIARFAVVGVFCAAMGTNATIAMTSINTAESRRRFIGSPPDRSVRRSHPWVGEW